MLTHRADVFAEELGDLGLAQPDGAVEQAAFDARAAIQAGCPAGKALYFRRVRTTWS